MSAPTTTPAGPVAAEAARRRTPVEPPPPGPRATLHQTLTMAYRGLLKVRHTPEQLIDVTLQPVVFTVMFTYIFGGAVSGDVASYLPVIVPGVLVQTVVTGSVVTGVQLREDLDKGVFDRFRSLPIARSAPLAGALLADVVRYVVATAVTLGTGMLLGYRPAGGVVGVAAAGALVVGVSWALSWVFALVGLLARSTGAVQGISMLVLFPLTFASNAFVTTDTMPGPLRWFADVNPVSHLVTAVRQLTSGASAGHELAVTLVGAAVVVALAAPAAVAAYLRRA